MASRAAGAFARAAGPLVLALACLGAAGGCRHQAVPPSYPGGQAPAVAALLDAAEPPVAAVAVPRAKIRVGPHRGTLAYLAQLPGRVRGSVTIAGNELVSLSVHERGYQLVYKLDGLPQGYYEGPAPGECAVAVLVGVALSPELLARALLGGAPILEDGRVVAQAWDPEVGAERLTLLGGGLEQALWFRAVEGAWRFVRVATWRRSAGGRGDLLWTLEVSSWRSYGGRRLPAELRLARHDLRRAPPARITLQEVNVAPPWTHVPRPDETAGGSGAEEEAGTGGDEWGADDGWENEGDAGGWENEGAGRPGAEGGGQGAAADSGRRTGDGEGETVGGAGGRRTGEGAPADGEAAGGRPAGGGTTGGDEGGGPRGGAGAGGAGSAGAGQTATGPEGAGGAARAAARPAPELPAVWRLPVPQGLPHRGDLCARR